MNPDIWPTAVNHFYELALNGWPIDGHIIWESPVLQYHNARGRLQAYDNNGVRGLSGSLNNSVPGAPGAFEEMTLKIEHHTDQTTVAKTTVTTVTVTAPDGQVQTNKAVAAYPWAGNSGICWIPINLPTDSPPNFIDIWLFNNFANAITQPVSSIIEGALALRRR